MNDTLRPFQVHDLVRIAADTQWDQEVQAWVGPALARAPWCVVRRIPYDGERVPIGVRGISRKERYGDYVAPHAILEIVPPESVLSRFSEGIATADTSGPRTAAVSLAHALTPLLAPFDIPWGPVGSVGFELSSGVIVTHDSSDLDLMMRCPAPLPRAVAVDMLQILQDASQRHESCRIDAIIETPIGGVSLAEYAGGDHRILLRAAQGVRLVSDPWAPLARTSTP